MDQVSATQEPSSDDHLVAEIASEQAHLDRVYAQLERTQKIIQKQAEGAREILPTDRTYWFRPEDDGTAAFERDVFAYQAARRIAELEAHHEGLVFGRIDLLDNQPRHIGRIGVRTDNYEPLVLDWRAPAAEPFYRATSANPMDVVRRRVLRCDGPNVVGIEDDLLDSEVDSDLVIVGEGSLLAALARARTSQMRDIVATIQAEQDEAIRAPLPGVTVISGGPGTGKTVVALHRAAFLLYTYRERLQQSRVLVVGPTRTFLNYIERVLPSLGEDAVTLRSVGSAASDVLALRSERVESTEVATIKGSLKMLPILRRAATHVWVRQPLRASIKGVVVEVSVSELDEVRERVLARHRVNEGLPNAHKEVISLITDKLPETMGLTSDEVESFVTDTAAWAMFWRAWWPTKTPSEILHALGELSLLAQWNQGELTPRECELLVDSYATNELSVADVALADELAAIMGPVSADPEEEPELFLGEGAREELVTTADLLSREAEASRPDGEPRTFGHILVDEAQDITPMQWRMLRRRGPQASWTIVGDPAQSSWPDPLETAKSLEDLIGSRQHRQFRLSTNYRSPAEVFELASKVIAKHYPKADFPDAVRKTGEHPLCTAIPSSELFVWLATQVTEMASWVTGTMAIIAPQSRFDAIQRWATTQGVERLSVVTPLEAKGLEYDGVIVVSPDEIVTETAGGFRTLYVALTRPTQRLVTVDLTGETPGDWRKSL